MTKSLKPYHYAWLMAHPDRSAKWLRARMADGFHIHHLDGDHSNNIAQNLVLIEAEDHLRLHGMNFKTLLSEGRRRTAKRKREKRVIERGLPIAQLQNKGLGPQDIRRRLGISTATYHRRLKDYRELVPQHG